MNTLKQPLEDLAELKKAIESLPVERRDAAECLFVEITFIHGVLEKLKERINNDGAVIKTARTVKENPALKAYNVSIMRYSQLLKQVTDLLPEAEQEKPTDPFINFITPKVSS